MRRLLFLLLAFFVAASCIDSQTGDDTGIVTDPVSECVVPPSARSGAEVILQWNGFTDDASVILRSASGDETLVYIKVITRSGMIFVVPPGTEPGMYGLFLVQDGEHDLGSIEILPPLIPVSGVSVPSSCMAGETVTVKGTGFKPSSSVVLVGKDGSKHEIEAEYGAGGLSFVVPDDIPEGDYSVYLVQDGNEWLLSESLSVQALSMKKLASVAYQGPYMGTTQIRYTWKVTEDEPLRILLVEATVDAGGNVDEGSYDEYTAVAENAFEMTNDGMEASNDLSMTYSFDQDGRVVTSDVLIYGKSQPTEFTWSYDNDGYLLDVTYVASSGLRTFRELSYDKGNLVRFRNTEFVYDDETLKNHPAAPDVVWGYMAVMEKFDPFVYFPYLLGWYDMKSSSLPTAMTIASGTGTVTLPVGYAFDEDGYVVEMKWNDGGPSKVIFSYR